MTSATKTSSVRSKLAAAGEIALAVIFSLTVGVFVFLLFTGAVNTLVSIDRSERLSREHEKRLTAIEEKVRQQSADLSVTRNVSESHR
jgi:hypothetical protein